MAFQHHLVIASRFDQIAGARRWLSEHARAAGFQDKEIANLALAATEACTNVIKHAYGCQPDKSIELQLVIDEVKLVLTIRDVGVKFDLEAYQPPDLDHPHVGGYGVHIIRSLMDEVEYDTSGKLGTALTLVKYRHAPS